MPPFPGYVTHPFTVTSLEFHVPLLFHVDAPDRFHRAPRGGEQDGYRRRARQGTRDDQAGSPDKAIVPKGGKCIHATPLPSHPFPPFLPAHSATTTATSPSRGSKFHVIPSGLGWASGPVTDPDVSLQLAPEVEGRQHVPTALLMTARLGALLDGTCSSFLTSEASPHIT